jgi:hypothetical protein
MTGWSFQSKIKRGILSTPVGEVFTCRRGILKGKKWKAPRRGEPEKALRGHLMASLLVGHGLHYYIKGIRYNKKLL